MLRMTKFQPQVLSWAKDEQMEICTPQNKLWKYTDEPARVTTKSAKESRREKSYKGLLFSSKETYFIAPGI